MSSSSDNQIAIKMTRFFMRFAGFWIYKDKREKLFMDCAMIYTVGAILIAWVITGADLIHCRNDFYAAAYAACNAMTVQIILLKLTVFSIQRDRFLSLISFCYDNFWEREYDAFGTSIIRNCNKRCVVFVGTFIFFAQCTVVTYTLNPIFENVGKNETDRILPFNIWTDVFPVTSTPYYEMLFIIEEAALIHSGICYFAFDCLLCIINVHSAGQFRILQRQFECMCFVKEFEKRPDSCGKDSLDGHFDDFSEKTLAAFHVQKEELNACIRKHQFLIYFTERVESVYTFVILGQVIVLSLLICLVTYQAVLADGSLPRRMIFIVHSGGTFTQLFMFTLTCDDLTQSSEEVADAAYRAQWHSSLSTQAGRTFGRNIMTVIRRARRPAKITAGGFFPVSLETFTTILSTSMSYLTMLRKGQEHTAA